MTEPTCRACYAATLTPDERERFNAEPVTSCIYLCPEHAEVIDRATRDFMGKMFDRKTEPCRFGYEERDGARYCYEHAGFLEAGVRSRRCDRALVARDTAPDTQGGTR